MSSEADKNKALIRRFYDAHLKGDYKTAELRFHARLTERRQTFIPGRRSPVTIGGLRRPVRG